MCVNPCPGKWVHSNGKGFLNQDTLAYLTPFYWQAKAPFHLRGTARNQTSLNSPDGALILASHAGVFRGARFSSLHVGRDEKRAPRKTPAWEASLIWAYPRQPRKPKPFHWLKETRVEKDVGLRMSDDVTIKDPGDRLYMAWKKWATRKQSCSKESWKRSYLTRQCNLRHATPPVLPQQNKRLQNICLSASTHVLAVYFSHENLIEVDLRIKRLLAKWEGARHP